MAQLSLTCDDQNGPRAPVANSMIPHHNTVDDRVKYINVEGGRTCTGKISCGIETTGRRRSTELDITQYETVGLLSHTLQLFLRGVRFKTIVSAGYCLSETPASGYSCDNESRPPLSSHRRATESRWKKMRSNEYSDIWISWNNQSKLRRSGQEDVEDFRLQSPPIRLSWIRYIGTQTSIKSRTVPTILFAQMSMNIERRYV